MNEHDNMKANLKAAYLRNRTKYVRNIGTEDMWFMYYIIGSLYDLYDQGAINMEDVENGIDSKVSDLTETVEFFLQ